MVEAKALWISPPSSQEVLALAGGLIAAYLSGYVALRLLIRVVRGGRLDRFAYYCWALGGVGLAVLWI